MDYNRLKNELQAVSEPALARFHGALIKEPPERLFGVRTPTLRKIAKRWNVDTLLSFPDEYYEVTFIKLVAVSYLPYEQFLQYADKAVPLITNWALCDSFKANCIKGHRVEFLPWIEKFHAQGDEFSVRYALVTLLSYYICDEYLPVVFKYLRKTDCSAHYVHMAAAWLTAEILVKHFGEGVRFLQEGALDAKTHNKAIQKAVESFRLTKEQKEQLKALKIKIS